MRLTVARLFLLLLASPSGCSLSHNPDLPSLGDGDSPIGDGDVVVGDGDANGDGDGDGDGDGHASGGTTGADGTGGAAVFLGAGGHGALGLGGLGGAALIEPPIDPAGGSTMGGASSEFPQEN